MKTYIARDLFKSLFIAACLTLAGATAFGQGPARTTTTNRCSGEVKTQVLRNIVATPRFVGTCDYVRPSRKRNRSRVGNRRVSLFDWSSKGKRVPRAWIAR